MSICNAIPSVRISVILYLREVHLPVLDIWSYSSHAEHEQQVAWGRHHFGAWLGKLDTATAQAICEYKAQSDSFQNYLRDTRCAATWHPDRELHVAQQSGLIEAALKTTSIPQEIVVYRGTRQAFPPVLTVGQTVTDLAFMATSLSLAVAEEFACWDDPDELATVLAIRVPPGYPGAWVEELWHPDIREYEVLLPPATTLVVEKVEQVSSAHENLTTASMPVESTRRRAICQIL